MCWCYESHAWTRSTSLIRWCESNATVNIHSHVHQLHTGIKMLRMFLSFAWKYKKQAFCATDLHMISYFPFTSWQPSCSTIQCTLQTDVLFSESVFTNTRGWSTHFIGTVSTHILCWLLEWAVEQIQEFPDCSNAYLLKRSIIFTPGPIIHI